MFKTHQPDKRPFIFADRRGGSASHDDRRGSPRRRFIAGLSCRQLGEGERERLREREEEEFFFNSFQMFD